MEQEGRTQESVVSRVRLDPSFSSLAYSCCAPVPYCRKNVFCYHSAMQSFSTDSDDAPPASEKRQSFSVCLADALPKGSCRRFALPNGDELAIYNVNGEYYATDNFCPHRGAALSDGALVGHIVECGWHGWQFDVRTGECLTVTEKIKTFLVRVSNGEIVVEVADVL